MLIYLTTQLNISIVVEEELSGDILFFFHKCMFQISKIMMISGRRFSYVVALLSLCDLRSVSSLSVDGKPSSLKKASQLQDRRNALVSTFGASIAIFGGAQSSMAFSNKISDKYDDRPKRKGPQPKDLGVGTRKNMDGDEYVGLKQCGAAPNCFCSTDLDDPDHLLPSWSWPDGLSKSDAFQQLEDVVNSYEPGQKGIDGGGFKVMKVDKNEGYIYVQFEALKNGYIDDLEFAFIDGYGDGRTVQLRSSSRVGYLDFGVNAKRINFLSKKVKDKGWIAEGVDPKTHEFYVMENSRG